MGWLEKILGKLGQHGHYIIALIHRECHVLVSKRVRDVCETDLRLWRPVHHQPCSW
jgi:hypothetical protein